MVIGTMCVVSKKDHMMEALHHSILIIVILLLLLVSQTLTDRVDAYENFTVGDSQGWRPRPVENYTTWALGKNFTLGDFLS